MRLSFPILMLACALFLPWRQARAADPQPYKVDFVGSGNAGVDATVKATSDLQALRSSAPVSPFGLIARARSDLDRLKSAVESFGYYQSAVAIRINGVQLNDPSLGDVLTALPKGASAQVSIAITLGTRYTLRNIEVGGVVPAGVNARDILQLHSGQPAIADDVLAAGARLLKSLQELGFPFAKVDAPVAYEAADAPALDLTFNVQAGNKANIGEIRFQGLKKVHEKLLRKRLRLKSGASYRPTAIEQARLDLLALNVFSQVSVSVGQQADATGGVPITFIMRERPARAVALAAAFSSDLGGSATVTWTDRNLFGNAEKLELSASVINLGGGDTNGTGYDTSAKYSIPEFLHRDQTLQFVLSAVKQQLQAYDQTSRTAGVSLSRKLSSLFTVSAGLMVTDDHIVQPPQTVTNGLPPTLPAGCMLAAAGCEPNPAYEEQAPLTRNYTLLALPFTVTYDSTHLASPLLDPTRGYRGSLTLTPTEAFGSTTSTFLITQVKAAGYFDLQHWFGESPGRTVFAVRTIVGQALGANEFSLPPDQRFYGGGSATIRGYGYQKVGPLFVGDTNYPIGGTAITAVGGEVRQRFGQSFGAAAFIDAGQVSAKLKFLPDQLRVGVGAGIRYYTPIGPIRFDLALPTKKDRNDDSFEIYIGLGQAF